MKPDVPPTPQNPPLLSLQIHMTFLYRRIAANLDPL
jgi:hypothetical protein